jgi:hypothetical protein
MACLGAATLSWPQIRLTSAWGLARTGTCDVRRRTRAWHLAWATSRTVALQIRDRAVQALAEAMPGEDSPGNPSPA